LPLKEEDEIKISRKRTLTSCFVAENDRGAEICHDEDFDGVFPENGSFRIINQTPNNSPLYGDRALKLHPRVLEIDEQASGNESFVLESGNGVGHALIVRYFGPFS
jgi:hypothetical protein